MLVALAACGPETTVEVLFTADAASASSARTLNIRIFADGEPICDAVRAVYRRYFDKGAAQPQRDPFAMDRQLYDLPCEELPERADAPVTRLMYAAWKMRADLQQAFDLSRTEGRRGYIRWFARAAEAEMGIPQRHLQAARRTLAALDDWEAYFRPCQYRPLDWRWIFWHPAMIDWPRHEVTQQFRAECRGQSARCLPAGTLHSLALLARWLWADLGRCRNRGRPIRGAGVRCAWS